LSRFVEEIVSVVCRVVVVVDVVESAVKLSDLVITLKSVVFLLQFQLHQIKLESFLSQTLAA
jgi:hypothetical protein